MQYVFSQNNKEKGHSRKESLLIAKEEDLSAPIILTTKQMYHNPPITNFQWKYPTTSGLILQRPPLSLSLAPSRFLFPRETREQFHGLIRDRAENISSIPCSKKSRKMSVIGKIERKRKRKRERDRMRACVSQSKKEYRLVYCARPSVGINALQSACDADYSEIF